MFPLSVKVIMFDLDGTLVDSAPDLAHAVNRMLADTGRRQQPLDTIAAWIGNGMARLVKRALTGEMHGEPEPALFERALASFKQHYAANLTEHTRPFPGVIEALATLSTQGFALACVTNKPAMFTEPLLVELDMRRYFALVVSGDTLPQRKPDPLPLTHVCRHFDTAAAHATLIGDSANDVKAARAAGMAAIAVSYGYNHGQDVRALQPDLVVDSLAQVPQYLRLCTA